VGDFSGLTHLSAVLKPGATLEMLAVGSAAAAPDVARKAAAAPPAGTTQTGATQTGAPQTGAPHSGVPHTGVPHTGVPQAGISPTGGPQAGIPQPGTPQAGIPWQAARALEAAVHGLHVDVTVIGRHGESAADLLAQMRLELRHKAYRLVLWQTGTIEAVDEQPPEDFYQTLADGAAAANAAGADLVLIDPQYSRFLTANANVEPYLAALKAAAALPGVGLFHRFDIMHDWADDGSIDLENAPKADRQAIRARLHGCLGRELARELLEE
jgi:phage terminase large subunit-like protein